MSRSSKILSLCLEPNRQHNRDDDDCLNKETEDFVKDSNINKDLDKMQGSTTENDCLIKETEDFVKDSNINNDLDRVQGFTTEDDCLIKKTEDFVKDSNINKDLDRMQGNTTEDDCLIKETLDFVKDFIINKDPDQMQGSTTECEDTDDSVKDPNYKNTPKRRKKFKVISHSRSSSTTSKSSSSSSSSSNSSSSSSSNSSSSSSSSSTPVSRCTQPNEDIQDERPTVPQEYNLNRNPEGENEPTTTAEMKTTRKRRRNEGQWKQNVTKVLRNSGLPYKTKSGRFMPIKNLKEGCGERCRLKCSSFLTNEMRLQIFDSYWALKDLEKQRQFIHKHLRSIEVKYRYTKAQKPRKSNYAFYFEVEGSLKRICKTMFKNTLDINDRTIRTVTEKSSGGFLQEDNRGKHNKHYTVDEAIKIDIRNHIKGIPRIESHYLRAQTTREYIDGGKTIADLHRDYVDQCKRDGRHYGNYVMYSRIFNGEFNLGFFVPKKDRCEVCVAYENATVEEKVKLKDKYDAHLVDKDLARQEKQKDKEALKVNKNLVVAVYDLQAVLPVPRGDVSVFYYKSKLNSMNFTVSKLKAKETEKGRKTNQLVVASGSDDSEPIVNQSITQCYFWHEGEGNRGADEIGSCLLKFIEKELHNHTGNEPLDIVFYSDNCCGQQKNKYIIGLYMYAVMKYDKVNSISHKFLIAGHTQNEGDSVHSVIEKQIKRSLKSGPIYVPSQYVQIIKDAKKTGEPLSVNELSHKDFISLKSLISDMGITTLNKIKVSDIKVMTISKDSPSILKYKTSYTDTEWSEGYLLSRNKKLTVPDIKQAYSSKLQIKENKKTDLMTLLRNHHIPSFYCDFYNNL